MDGGSTGNRSPVRNGLVVLWNGRPKSPLAVGSSNQHRPYHMGTMQITYTAAGTPVIERTPEEYAAHLEREVQREIGMSVA